VNPSNAANKTVTWATSNPAVATVNTFGQVTAVAPGTADITVTTNDGGYHVTCRVTVVPQGPATGVILDKTRLSLILGESETLTKEQRTLPLPHWTVTKRQPVK